MWIIGFPNLRKEMTLREELLEKGFKAFENIDIIKNDDPVPNEIDLNNRGVITEDEFGMLQNVSAYGFRYSWVSLHDDIVIFRDAIVHKIDTVGRSREEIDRIFQEAKAVALFKLKLAIGKHVLGDDYDMEETLWIVYEESIPEKYWYM